MKERCGSIIFS